MSDKKHKPIGKSLTERMASTVIASESLKQAVSEAKANADFRFQPDEYEFFDSLVAEAKRIRETGVAPGWQVTRQDDGRIHVFPVTPHPFILNGDTIHFCLYCVEKLCEQEEKEGIFVHKLKTLS